MIRSSRARLRRPMICLAAVLVAVTAVACAVGDDPGALSHAGTGEETPVYVCPPCGCGNDHAEYSQPGTCPACGMALLGTRSVPVELSAEQWLEDLRYLVERIETVHPDPFFRLPRERFSTAVADLERRIPKLEKEQIVAGLMRLLASLDDGHSSLDPSGPAVGFDRWFPIRIDEFADGLFLAAVPAERAELFGARVEKIAGLEASEAWRRAAELAEGDNRMSRMYRTSFIASQANLLRGLGILDQVDVLSLELTLPDGTSRTVEVASIVEPYSLHWFWMLGTIPGGGEPVDLHSTLGDALPPGYRRMDDFFRLDSLEEARALYVRLDYVQDRSDLSLGDFLEAMWREFDERHADRLIIDLRHNPGGNNRLLVPLVEAIVARPGLNQRGRLFAITGRRTYSAAMDGISMLREATEMLLVGEPPGGSLISHGDAQHFTLPNSGMSFSLSVYRWALGALPWDQQCLLIPQLPVILTAEDYFAGRDLALEAILDYEASPPLADRLLAAHDRGGLAAVRSAYAEYKKRHPDRAWWTSEADWIELLGMLEDRGDFAMALEAGRLAAAMAR